MLDGDDRFGGGGVLREGKYPRVHDATRGPFGILKNFGYLRGRLLTTHQLADFVGKRLGEPIDQRRGIVWRQFLQESDDVMGRPRGERRGTHVNPELGDDLHRQPRIGGRHRIHGGPAFVIVERAEDFGNIDGMPLLQQVQEVSGRTNAQQSTD